MNISELKEKAAYKQLILAKALAPDSDIIDMPILYLENFGGHRIILHHMDKANSEISATELPKYIEKLNTINETVQTLTNDYCLSEECGNLSVALGFSDFKTMWADEEFSAEINKDAAKLRASIQSVIDLVKSL